MGERSRKERIEAIREQWNQPSYGVIATPDRVWAAPANKPEDSIAVLLAEIDALTQEKATWVGLAKECGGRADRLAAALREMAEAAQSYLDSGVYVGVTDEQKRAAHQRLASLIGPHLMAHAAKAEVRALTAEQPT